MSLFVRPMRTMVLSVFIVAASLVPAAEEKLVPANLADRNDALGMRWDIRQEGFVDDGTSDCFDRAMILHINGRSFNQQKPPQQTADGSELVVSGRIGAIEVTRRIKLDAKRNVLRYVEMLTNPGQKTESVAVMMQNQLGGSCMQTVWNDGKPQNGAALAKDCVGVAALQQPGQRPSVIWLIGDPKAPTPPVLMVGDNRQYQFTWNLTIESHQTRMILHYVMQRPSLTATQVPDAVKPLWKKGSGLVKPDLPRAWFRNVVNFRMTAAGDEDEELTRNSTIVHLLERAGVEDDGSKDLVGVGRSEAERMRGTLTGGPLTVTTPQGPVTVTVDELAGGEGGDPVALLHLRTGESLAASRIDGTLAIETEAGVALPVDPYRMLWLATRAKRDDARPPAGQRGLLELADGTCLGLAALDATVTLAGTWGRITLPLTHIHRIARVLEPTPAWRVTCDDGSTIRAVPEASDLTVATKRFGAVTVPMGTLMAFRHAEAPAPNDDDPEDGARLVSGERLAGGLAGPALVLRAGGQDSAIPVERIVAIERPEEGGAALAVVLTDGGRLVGTPAEGTVGFLVGGVVVRIPTERIQSWKIKSKPEAEGKDEAKPADQDKAKNGTEATAEAQARARAEAEAKEAAKAKARADAKEAAKAKARAEKEAAKAQPAPSTGSEKPRAERPTTTGEAAP